MNIELAMNLPLTDIEFVQREVTLNEILRGTMMDFQSIHIGVKNKKTGTIYPCIFTSFIKEIYENDISSNINTLAKVAGNVVAFLNFIIDRIQEHDELFVGIKAVKDIKAVHAAKFICYKTAQGLQRRTVRGYGGTLLSFFQWLKDKGYSDEEVVIRWVERARTVDRKKEFYKTPLAPFKQYGANYPTKKTLKPTKEKLKDFGDEDDDERRKMTEYLINLSRDIAPEIALGLCLQFYGGLRKGEVVNLTKAEFNIEYRRSMEVMIRDNRALLFSRLIDTKKENPKRLSYLNTDLARQTIFDTNLVWDVYDEHFRNLDRLRGEGRLAVTTAVFIDNNGNPMSAKVYEKRFMKVKKAFIRSLRGHKNYDLFNGHVWNTHIGRGVFTNFLVSMNFLPAQIAIARGDRNLNSALDYIDKAFTKKQIREAVNELKSVKTGKFGYIDIADVKQFVETKWGDTK
ncbi:site-specific integrase [Priestia aryabhattai]|uniref:site-specific integrase n=1 Tax=Priestia aryabhattai TaxID=412384 RepID=UPI001EB54631|nr:site-specific integrase [Priestia aryabhattai]MBY0091429.1 site-specific integrase [Priestia aryabhattai]MBY0102316.1 site-specific integrase [Priestia aryabhattai]